MEDWTPISSGLLPEDMTDVQVTFLSFTDLKPICNEFAYIVDGKWYWTHSDSEVTVIITAWKQNCEPYQGK